jgi:GAF domain-containing protein
MSKWPTELEATDPFEHQLLGVVRATSEGADGPLDHTITDILRLVREHLGMDVVFVARLVNDLNVITLADSVSEEMDLEGFSHPRAESFCQRVLDGRLPGVIPDVDLLRSTHDVPELPVPVGSYMAAPVHLQDGSLYGMLCCLSVKTSLALNARDHGRLEMSARLVAQLVDDAAGKSRNETTRHADEDESEDQ